jgi:hypothetical protein
VIFAPPVRSFILGLCLLRLRAIESSVLNGFRDVSCGHAIDACKVRNSARDFENAIS